MAARPPVPPFNRETAVVNVRLAEDAWNSRDPEQLAPAYTADSWWRNRSEFLVGRQAIIALLTRKWSAPQSSPHPEELRVEEHRGNDLPPIR